MSIGPVGFGTIQTIAAESQGGVSSVGTLLYAGGEADAGQAGGLYRLAMLAGVLRRADPDIAALHLQGLLEAGIVEPGLFGAPPRVTIEDAVPVAIRAFMLIYGQDSAQGLDRQA
jgi:hypothetical protein